MPKSGFIYEETFLICRHPVSWIWIMRVPFWPSDSRTRSRFFSGSSITKYYWIGSQLNWLISAALAPTRSRGQWKCLQVAKSIPLNRTPMHSGLTDTLYTVIMIKANWHTLVCGVRLCACLHTRVIELTLRWPHNSNYFCPRRSLPVKTCRRNVADRRKTHCCHPLTSCEC